RHVSGMVKVKLLKGKSAVVGRKSPKSLYSYSLATYDEEDQFDQSAAEGFIQIYGLPVNTQAQVQGVEEGDR
ncbi:MAG: argininosuccinate synthase, partial [Dehalococcoidia bacterium]